MTNPAAAARSSTAAGRGLELRATTPERGGVGRGDLGAVAFLAGAGQRVEGSLSQQPLIGWCSIIASSDWAICSGRCCEARRGGASRQGSGAKPGIWRGGAAVGLPSPRRCDLRGGEAPPPSLPVPLAAPNCSAALKI